MRGNAKKRISTYFVVLFPTMMIWEDISQCN